MVDERDSSWPKCCSDREFSVALFFHQLQIVYHCHAQGGQLYRVTDPCPKSKTPSGDLRWGGVCPPRFGICQWYTKYYLKFLII